MKNVTLLAAACLALVPTAGASNSNRDRNREQLPESEIVRGIYGEPLGSSADMDTTLGGSFSNPFNPGRSANMRHRYIAEVKLNDPGTGWEERFLIGIPPVRLKPSPVLVLFHEYGGTPEKMLENTTYFKAAMARGWIVVAPLSAHQYNFSIEYAQVNTKAALDWVIANVDVDPDRFYAVGFSMGGGTATSYAARHLDPHSARFAAVVNHTGTTSIRDSYWAANDKNLMESPLMFGGAPDVHPFRYQTASTIDLDTFTGQIDPESDMGRNLSHVELKSFNAEGDPLWYLIAQTSRLHDHVLTYGTSAIYTQSTDTVHKWWTLDVDEVLDYFEGVTYAEPAAGVLTRTLADRDGRWFHFEIEQNTPGTFSPFRWTVLPALNRVVVDQAENFNRFVIDPASAGLNASQPIEVIFECAEDRALEVAVKGIASAPSDVLINGQPTGEWAYDAASDTVTLFEDAIGSYPKWTIQP